MKNAPGLPEVQEGPKFRKLRFNPETEEFIAEMAELWGVSVQKYVLDVLEFHRHKKHYPHHPGYEAKQRERQTHQRREERRQQAVTNRVDRQVFAAETVFYRRPMGRPPIVPPPTQRGLNRALEFGKHLLTPPYTGVDITDFVYMFLWDIKPPEARKEPRHKPLDPNDARGRMTCHAWRMAGHVELIRRAPDGSEFSTLWFKDDVPPIGVMLDPADDPWTHRLTPHWYTSPTTLK